MEINTKFSQQPFVLNSKSEFKDPWKPQLKPKLRWYDHVREYVLEFGQESSLPGVAHVLSPNRHPIERIFWACIFISSMAYATTIILSNNHRYNTNPTVTSLEKNHLDWNITYPSATICYIDRVNETKVNEFVERNMSADTEEKVALYRRFIHAVANLSIRNMEIFKEFAKYDELDNISTQMEEIAVEVSADYNVPIPEKMIGQELRSTPVLIEFGKCFTAGSPIAQYMAPMPIRGNETLREMYRTGPLYCQEINGKCFSMLTFTGAIRYVIHSPYEIVQAGDKSVFTDFGSRKVCYMSEEIRSDHAVSELKRSQRHCFLRSEKFKGMPFSSFNTCLMMCRYQMSLDLCGCAPYFYNPLGQNGPVCNAKGLACLSEHYEELVQLKKTNKRKCQCMQPCDVSLMTHIRTEAIGKRESKNSGIFMAYGLIVFSRTRYSKQVLFGIEDLLVSYGGTAGFFLGWSILSVAEVIYYCTLRPISRTYFSSPERGTSAAPKKNRQRNLFITSRIPPATTFY